MGHALAFFILVLGDAALGTFVFHGQVHVCEQVWGCAVCRLIVTGHLRVSTAIMGGIEGPSKWQLVVLPHYTTLVWMNVVAYPLAVPFPDFLLIAGLQH